MQVDLIVRTMVQHEVEFLLIGGMNFMLRHEPVLTFDIDFWINDTQQNRSACEKALGELDAEWGPTESEWGPVAGRVGWLTLQGVYCLTSPVWEHRHFQVCHGVRKLAGIQKGCCSHQHRRRSHLLGNQ
jgi:hypothetical protein